jgi:hypothetical protein
MLSLALFVLPAVLSRVTTFNEFSAVLTGPTGTHQYIASLLPDPVTGNEQPIKTLNSSLFTFVGGISSYVGGVALVYPTNGGGLTSGSRVLETFDLSSKGWLTWPSTTVTKTAQGTVAYSRNCTSTFPCAYPSAGTIQATYGMGTVTLEVDRRGTPQFMNVSYPQNAYFQFVSFSRHASTYQTNPSLYTLGANFYSSNPPLPPNVTTVSFYRSANNDSFIRNMWNDNVATPSGEAAWAGCQSSSSQLVFVRFDVQIDQNFVAYSFCNGGSCPSSFLDLNQKIGTQPPFGSPSSYPNTMWFSISAAARCARGFPIGTNNCSVAHDYKLVKAVTGACYVNSTYADPAMSPQNPAVLCQSNYSMIGAHIVSTLQRSSTLCPDVSAQLPPLPDSLL